jgi:hypothetical protein
MNSIKILEEKKKCLINEISKLGAFRKGSLTEQYLKSTGKDGCERKHGPYCIYTFKENKKTFSKRIDDLNEKEKYREQIENFRRFQKLMEELSLVSRQLADIGIDEDKKKFKKLSEKKKKMKALR